MDEPLQHTPLEPAHVALKARLVPFAGWLMPVMVTGAEVTATPSATPFWSTNAKGSATVSGGTVVLVNVPATPPIVRVVTVSVPVDAALVWRTQTVCPFDTRDGALVYVPVQPTE